MDTQLQQTLKHFSPAPYILQTENYSLALQITGYTLHTTCCAMHTAHCTLHTAQYTLAVNTTHYVLHARYIN